MKGVQAGIPLFWQVLGLQGKRRFVFYPFLSVLLIALVSWSLRLVFILQVRGNLGSHPAALRAGPDSPIGPTGRPKRALSRA